MSNLFDRSNYPRIEPDKVTVGEYVRWRKDDLSSDYDPDSYSLRYDLRLQSTTATEINITATESGGVYYIEVPSATTASWTKGTYSWQAVVIRASDSEEIVVNTGTIEIKQSFDDETADPRTHYKKMLDLIDARLEDRMTSDIANYTIQGRSLAKIPIPELLKIRDYYQTKYKEELKREARAKGKNAGNNIFIRFQ